MCASYFISIARKWISLLLIGFDYVYGWFLSDYDSVHQNNMCLRLDKSYIIEKAEATLQMLRCLYSAS